MAESSNAQTPPDMAAAVVECLRRIGARPFSLVDPACGDGALLTAAAKAFGAALRKVVAYNSDAGCRAELPLSVAQPARQRIDFEFEHGEFFATDWSSLFRELPQPLLVIASPPWQKPSARAKQAEKSLCDRSNFPGSEESNIAERMAIELLEALNARRGSLAMLVETRVARAALAYAWEQGFSMEDARLFRIEELSEPGAGSDVGLLYCQLGPRGGCTTCRVFSSLKSKEEVQEIGWRNGELVANVKFSEKWHHLDGPNRLSWYPGIKHGCAKVMELTRLGDGQYRNGFDEVVHLESEYVFPMLSGSEAAKSPLPQPERWMLVTQREEGADTVSMSARAPKTWSYLKNHRDFVERRRSSIFENRPPFAVIGVGPHSFSEWKIAVSGFYRALKFQVVGPFHGRPVVVDDTAALLPVPNEARANLYAEILNSQPVREFYSSFIFWDAKPPVTIDILNRLDIEAAAKAAGCEQTGRR